MFLALSIFGSLIISYLYEYFNYSTKMLYKKLIMPTSFLVGITYIIIYLLTPSAFVAFRAEQMAGKSHMNCSERFRISRYDLVAAILHLYAPTLTSSFKA